MSLIATWHCSHPNIRIKIHPLIQPHGRMEIHVEVPLKWVSCKICVRIATAFASLLGYYSCLALRLAFKKRGFSCPLYPYVFPVSSHILSVDDSDKDGRIFLIGYKNVAECDFIFF